MIASADKDFARFGLLLEMAFQTKVCVPLGEHLVVDRAMRIVAGGAAFADCFVLENKWAALSGVTFCTGVRI